MVYVVIFCIALGASFLFTLGIKRIAVASGIVDHPGAQRKIHTKPIALLGGIGIFLALGIVGTTYYFFAPSLFPSLIDDHVTGKHLVGLLLAGLILCIGGYLDDRYVFKPHQTIVMPFFAIFVLLAFGIGVDSVTNPLNGRHMVLDQWANIITFMWLFGTMYTTKLLDGLDGLVSGITVIGATVIGVVSLFFFVNEPTALLSFLTAGAFAGFLILNFNPAKIFLGEAGSTLAGFLLGTLAIISGAKFAIAMLVLGIPILDTIWVIYRRVVIERRSPFTGDRKHLHFRMLDAGFSQRQTVFILWAVSALFGAAALFMQTQQKVTALVLLVGVMLFLVLLLKWKRSKGQ